MARAVVAIFIVILVGCAVQPLPPEASFGPQDATAIDGGADLTGAVDANQPDTGQDTVPDVPDMNNELPVVADALGDGDVEADDADGGEIADDDADGSTDDADAANADEDAIADEMDAEDVEDVKIQLDIAEILPPDVPVGELPVVDVQPPVDAADVLVVLDTADAVDAQDLMDAVDAIDASDAPVPVDVADTTYSADTSDSSIGPADTGPDLPLDAAKSDVDADDALQLDGKSDIQADEVTGDVPSLCNGFSNCDDGNPCTTEKCDSALGCVYQSNSDPCDDLNPCTEKDKCKVAKCVGTPVNCDDGNVCTTEVCVEKFGCFKSVNQLPCSDDNPCTIGDVCKDSVCSGKALAPDADNDGFTSSVCGGPDCDDSNPKVHPGGIEDCASVLVDDNCNGKFDEENALGCVSYFFDGDADGFGASNLLGKCLCKAGQALNYVAKVSGDCDDAKPAINPGAIEVCNPAGIDENCNGAVDEICPCAKPGFTFPTCNTCGDSWLLISTNTGDVCAPLFPLWGIQGLSPNTLTFNADGTVTDSLTLLTWEKSASAVPMHWSEAKNYCKAQMTAGKNNWRLPTTAE